MAGLLATGITVALITSACGGGGGGETSGAGGDTSDTIIRVYGTEPENPLVPSNTNEVGGSKVLDGLFSGLIDYRPENAEPFNVVAESIETDDSQNYTITLEEGWTFHDGTPVTAESFVNAWNYGAYGPNGQLNSTFYANIAGWDELNPEDPDGEDGPAAAPTPTVDTLSGLAVVDERTFTVALSAPFSVFPSILGYQAFYPLPEAFFTDQAAWEANPVGNGPFTFSARQPNVNIEVTRWDEWPGENGPTVGGVEFAFYESPDSAYADLVAGNLDYMEQLPPSSLVGRLFEQDLPDRNVSQTYLGINTFTFPLYDPRYQNVAARQAISMAIDRQAVSDQVYDGLREPAGGLVPPALDGYVEGQCGELCTFNPARAQELFAQSGFTGPIEIASNVDGAGNQEVFQAICVSVSNTLGVPCNFVSVPTFSEFRTAINAGTMTTAFRTGWSADYPSIENFLNPLYKTGASSNDGGYTNPQVDALLETADAAASVDEAYASYQEAERLILQDMPIIPTFYSTTQAGWSDRLVDPITNQFRELDINSVGVAE